MKPRRHRETEYNESSQAAAAFETVASPQREAGVDACAELLGGEPDHDLGVQRSKVDHDLLAEPCIVDR